MISALNLFTAQPEVCRRVVGQTCPMDLILDAVALQFERHLVIVTSDVFV